MFTKNQTEQIEAAYQKGGYAEAGKVALRIMRRSREAKSHCDDQQLQDAVSRLRNLADSDLFTVEEDGDKRSLGSKGVGISWAMWRDIRRVVKAYLEAHP